MTSATITSKTTHFRAMGSHCELQVVGGGNHLVSRAIARIVDLENKWSRFLPGSEVSRLNAARGTTRTVSADTAELIEKAVVAWHLTQGHYDPTVLDALVAAGYEASLELIDGSVVALVTRPAPGCRDIVRDAHQVTIPHGVGFDPGGIGKGLAGDIVARDVVESGARGIMVNLGGDVRVAGEPPDGDLWMIAIDEPAVHAQCIATVALTDGAVATSTTRKRQWRSSSGMQHHLIDPATGAPNRGNTVLASAIATEGWWAEAQTKALMSIDPRRVPSWAEDFVGLVVSDEEELHRLGGFARYER